MAICNGDEVMQLSCNKLVTFFIVMILGSCLLPTPVSSHEAWFLKPDEMLEISKEIPPVQFLSPFYFGMVLAPLALITMLLILVEPRWRPFEERLFTSSSIDFRELSSMILCLGLALMMFISAFGLLPMMGQPSGSATLLVANGILDQDQLLTPIIFSLQVALALMLVSGFQARLAALGVIILALTGHVLFGASFIDFSPHFIAPALLILSFGRTQCLCWGGTCQCLLERLGSFLNPTTIYSIARIMTGAGFAYLGFRYKLLEPGLVIKILEHTPMNIFDDWAGPLILVMGFVEFTAGFLLIFGVLVRPVALFLIFAFTFFACILGESVFYHSQLYALSVVFFLCGPKYQFTQQLRQPADAVPFLTAMPGCRRRNISGGFADCGRSTAALFAIMMIVVWNSVPQIHQADLREVSFVSNQNNEPMPEMQLTANIDLAGNWYVILDVENFQLEGARKTSSSAKLSGHAHIYLDSRKVATARSSKIMLGALKPGRHVITADLRTPDHKLIVTENGAVTKRIEIVVGNEMPADDDAKFVLNVDQPRNSDICFSSNHHKFSRPGMQSTRKLENFSLNL